jgi:hypothetical protein
MTSAPGGADSKRSACGSGLIVIQPGTQEGAVALEHPESTRTMTPLAAMAATSRTRTRPSSRYCGEPRLTLVKLAYEFHLEMWPDCCCCPWPLLADPVPPAKQIYASAWPPWSLTTKQVEARPARRLPIYIVVIPAFIHSQRDRIEPRRHRVFIQLFNRRHFSTRGQP